MHQHSPQRSSLRKRSPLASASVLAFAAIAMVWSVSSAASAQQRMYGLSLGATSGMRLNVGGEKPTDMPVTSGTVDGQSMLSTKKPTTRPYRSRTNLEFGFRTWVDETPNPIYGGVLRLELEGGTALSMVPRLEMKKDWGLLAIRGGGGIPIYIFPYSLLGVEAYAALEFEFIPGFAAVLHFITDAYFLGSDLPKKSVLLNINGALGVEFTF